MKNVSIKKVIAPLLILVLVLVAFKINGASKAMNDGISVHLYYCTEGEVRKVYDYYLYGNELYKLVNEKLKMKKKLSKKEMDTVKRIIAYCSENPVFKYEDTTSSSVRECYLIVNNRLICYCYLRGLREVGPMPDDASAFLDFFNQVTE